MNNEIDELKAEIKKEQEVLEANRNAKGCSVEFKVGKLAFLCCRIQNHNPPHGWVNGFGGKDELLFEQKAKAQ